jgi:CRP/FNR family transcriptional regulator, nitrogen oxide reductase regulator
MPTPGAVAPCANLNSQLLRGFAPAELRLILASAKRRHFPANSVITVQGDSADRLFLLERGRARYFFNTEDGRKVLLLWLNPGDALGGATLVSKPRAYVVSTETLRDSWMFVWDRDTIRRLAVRYPLLLENFLLIASDYLGWYVAAHIALVSHTARQRLAGVLACLAETIGVRVKDGFEFDATNEELAGAANVTTYTASRLLSEWRSSHALVKRRGKILLRSPERLFLHTVQEP